MNSWRRLCRRSVLANLKSGRTFKGVLWDAHGSYLVLRQAETFHDGKAVPVDGEVVVDRAEIEFLQLLSEVPRWQ